MTCRNCEYLHVQNDKNGKRVPRKTYTYPCIAPLPTIQVPASVKQPQLSRRWMAPDEGEGCTFHKEIPE